MIASCQLQTLAVRRSEYTSRSLERSCGLDQIPGSFQECVGTKHPRTKLHYSPAPPVQARRAADEAVPVEVLEPLICLGKTHNAVKTGIATNAKRRAKT